MVNLKELYVKGNKVLYIPDNQYYVIEDVETDVLYLIDHDGSSFIATIEELMKIDINK